MLESLKAGQFKNQLEQQRKVRGGDWRNRGFHSLKYPGWEAFDKSSSEPTRSLLLQPLVNHRCGDVIAPLEGLVHARISADDHGEIFLRCEPHYDVPHGVRTIVH